MIGKTAREKAVNFVLKLTLGRLSVDRQIRLLRRIGRKLPEEWGKMSRPEFHFPPVKPPGENK